MSVRTFPLKRSPARRVNEPWWIGLAYLLCALVVSGLLATVTQAAPLWTHKPSANIYTSAKGQLRAIDKQTGAVKWTSKDFGGAVAELKLFGDVIYGRLGGAFYDFSKQHLLAFDQRAHNIVWSVKYEAPGVPG